MKDGKWEQKKQKCVEWRALVMYVLSAVIEKLRRLGAWPSQLLLIYLSSSHIQEAATGSAVLAIRQIPKGGCISGPVNHQEIHKVLSSLSVFLPAITMCLSFGVYVKRWDFISVLSCECVFRDTCDQPFEGKSGIIWIFFGLTLLSHLWCVCLSCLFFFSFCCPKKHCKCKYRLNSPYVQACHSCQH